MPGAGNGATAAAAASAACPTGRGAVSTIDQRDIQAAWLEYSRAAEYAHDPHALVGAELSFFGPAGLCPACAGTPESAGAAEAAAAVAPPRHSAEHLFDPGAAAAGTLQRSALERGLLAADARDILSIFSISSKPAIIAGHGATCCLRNSGLYLPGAGRRVGETCEQLWAQLKPLTSVTRYMAKPNYLDCIDDFLRFVAAARLAEFVPFMVEQHRSLVRKLEECRSRYTDLVAAAGRQGLTEMMSAAVDACGPADVAAPVALDAAAARLKLLVDYVVDAPGSDAVQLLPAVWTEAEVTKLFKDGPHHRGAGAAAL
ncbi:hypothetical protein OEZ86_006092 [Tetradesmus obliquus]|nr:hypothetical protein OEZ86_006092 [Tetradesmus obliquus]